MRYLDPESIKAKRVPTNYDTRAPDVRPRKYGRREGREGREENNDRWTRGGDAKPMFDRERAGQRDIDQYPVKSVKRETRADAPGSPGREGRKRDWDDWRAGRGGVEGGDRLDYAGKGANSKRNSTSPAQAERNAVEEPERLRGDVSEGESDMVMDGED